MGRLAIHALLVVALVSAVLVGCLGLETSKDNWLGWVLLVAGVGATAAVPVRLGSAGSAFWRASDRRRAEGAEALWPHVPGAVLVWAGAPLEYRFLPAVLPRDMWMQRAGAALLLLGAGLIVWTLIQLFRGKIWLQGVGSWAYSGPYRLIRHPGYAGLILASVGVATGYSSLIGLVAIPLVWLPGLVYRLGLEEKLLAERYGGAFRAYAQTTSRLIPGIW